MNRITASKFLVLAVVSLPGLLSCSDDASLGNNSEGVQSGADDDATSDDSESSSSPAADTSTEPAEHEPEDEPGSTGVADPTDAPSGVAEITDAEPSGEDHGVDPTSAVSGEDHPTSVDSTEESGEGGATHVPTSSSGAGGASPLPSAVGGSGGASSDPTHSCEEIQCFRAIECVETCGGPVLQASCCPCEEGTFDSIECSVGMGGASSGGASSGGASAGGTSAGGAHSVGGSGGAEVGGAHSVGGSGGASYDPELLNTECVEGTCSEGLTPVHFYGIAGPAGPEFCWCTIPCAEDHDVCPAGTACTTIADGPGEVCYAQEN